MLASYRDGVKEKTGAANRTLHVAKGTTKSINIKGLKKPVWTASPEGVVTVIKNKKISADEAGYTTLTASGNGTTYSIDVFVEELKLSDSANLLAADKGANKYKLELSAGSEDDIILDESVTQEVIFKSNKADIAFIDEEGVIHARKAGSCKITGKIAGKTITIKVNVSE
ncbi:MAG: hypothetical protein J6X66_00695 [Lachnospiraceae bacterium]|nr:hypothetical protein [Lachnospiraceae bacterium]